MKATCSHPECGEQLRSNLSGEHWHHLRPPRVPHRPRPEALSVEHTCTRPDPHCPGKGCGLAKFRKWAAKRLSEVDACELPWPGM